MRNVKIVFYEDKGIDKEAGKFICGPLHYVCKITHKPELGERVYIGKFFGEVSCIINRYEDNKIEVYLKRIGE